METVPKITGKHSYAESAFKLLGNKVVVNESTPFIDGIFQVFWSTAYGGAKGAGVCGLLWGSTLQTIHYRADRGNILS